MNRTIHLKDFNCTCPLLPAACLTLHLLPAGAQTAPPQGPHRRIIQRRGLGKA
jgi:hypothetical protein